MEIRLDQTVLALSVALLAPTLATTVGWWLTNRNARRAAETAERAAQLGAENSEKLDVIHRLVNSTLTDAQDRVSVLEAALKDQGIPLPRRQSPPAE